MLRAGVSHPPTNGGDVGEYNVIFIVDSRQISHCYVDGDKPLQNTLKRNTMIQ